MSELKMNYIAEIVPVYESEDTKYVELDNLLGYMVGARVSTFKEAIDNVEYVNSLNKVLIAMPEACYISIMKGRKDIIVSESFSYLPSLKTEDIVLKEMDNLKKFVMESKAYSKRRYLVDIKESDDEMIDRKAFKFVTEGSSTFEDRSIASVCDELSYSKAYVDPPFLSIENLTLIKCDNMDYIIEESQLVDYLRRYPRDKDLSNLKKVNNIYGTIYVG